EREAKSRQQRFGFLVILSRGGDADIQPTDCVNFVIFDFGQNNLLSDPEVVIDTHIECFTGQATDVSYSWQGNGNQPIEKLVHATAAQGYLATNGIAFSDLKPGDSLAAGCYNSFLAGNLGSVFDCIFNVLAVGNPLAHPHVQGDFGDA